MSEVNAQFYNGTQTTFGKNRVQYREFNWQFYRFNNYETYFYTGGQDLAEHTAKLARVKIDQLEKFLDFYLQERIQFIIFNKQSDFRQSNIGLSTDESYNIGGVTRIVGSKVFIYFEGDYEKFDKQIEAGILKVLIYQMLYGGNWREVLRNSALLHLPEWYITGLISYLSDPYNPEINAKIKDGILNERFDKFNTLAYEDPEMAGHALWNYIAVTYGKNVVSNILYMTRISREIDDGFLYVIGVSFEDLYTDMLNYYQREFSKASATEAQMGEAAPIKFKKNFRYDNFKRSPDNQYFIYNSNKLGQYKIYLYDLENEKRKRIFKAEKKLDRLQDYSYPIMDWHPSGKQFSFVTELKGQLWLYTYNLEDKKLYVKPILKIDKVLDFDYSKDGRQMVFSGVSNGQSDIYIYNVVGNTQKNLTNDIYDDLNAVFAEDDNKIYFISNRLNDSLNVPHQKSSFLKEKDVFAIDLTSDDYEIEYITNTPYEQESHPLIYDDKLYYLENKKGEIRRYTAEYDSAIASVDTTINYRYFYRTSLHDRPDRNVFDQSAVSEEGIDQLSFTNGRYFIGTEDFKTEITIDTLSPKENSSTQTSSNRRYYELTEIPKEEVNRKVNIYDYAFREGNNRELEETKAISESRSSKAVDLEDLDFPTQRLYRLNFKPDNTVLQLNNMYINQQYQTFNGGPYINAGVGVNTKIGIVDLMENHRIYGGFRFSGDLIEYSLSYQNLEKRLNKEFMVSRRRQRETGGIIPNDLKTLQATTSLIWPFSEVTSLRGVFTARRDRLIPLSTDRLNTQVEILSEYWATAQIAYVFDNTRNVALNIRYGTRFKIFAEHYQQVARDNKDFFGDFGIRDILQLRVNTIPDDIILTGKTPNLSVVGFDIRHYQKIHKEIIAVGRIAGSRSFGSTPLIYYMGGVDEWWKSDQFDQSTPIDLNQNYGYQALASNMRGFLQNVRNGNSFVVVNTEVRVPIFSYLIHRPIQSSFVRNFQIVGFADVGTAWVGESPFSDDNPINNESLTREQITVTYENINDPVVAGTGFGLRTTLLGYFVRADWGWGVENGVFSDESLFMFSLSLDI
ncbi:MAG: hypothetical protein CMP59_12750 [Flavobacteriales bacterium]|nr:hypothetical protein [Flavobacteriales bacterium]